MVSFEQVFKFWRMFEVLTPPEWETKDVSFTRFLCFLGKATGSIFCKR